MAIIYDKWNSVFIQNDNKRGFEIRYCPHDVKAPWSIHGKRTNGYYFVTLREVLAFAAGRGYIEPHMLDAYQRKVMLAFDEKLNEE